jgi:hypothetical protein
MIQDQETGSPPQKNLIHLPPGPHKRTYSAESLAKSQPGGGDSPTWEATTAESIPPAESPKVRQENKSM